MSQVAALFNRVRSRDEMTHRQKELQQAMDGIVAQWATEITRLGCEVKGLWLVDWDTGDGYSCWNYPEPTLGFFHSYCGGFASRVPID